MAEFEARPRVHRKSLHPAITAERISRLVDEFYAQVRDNPRLSPIFAAHISGDWGTHLQKMKSFWRSVLLKSGEYKGRPVPVHLKIVEIETADFEEWLRLFCATSQSIFEAEAAELVNEAATRIATSLWLSRSQDPHAAMPAWSKSSSTENLNREGIQLWTQALQA